MKVHLMYQDRDFDCKQKLTPQDKILARDLELDTLFSVMAGDDDLILDVVKKSCIYKPQK